MCVNAKKLIMKKKLFILALALGWTTIAQAILIRNDVPDCSYLDAANQIDYACQITLITKKNMITKGSGVLIRPNVVLTAAHVVDQMGGYGVVRLWSDVHKKHIWRRISKVCVHPGYVGGVDNYKDRIDLAIVVLDEPIHEVAPAKLATASYQYDGQPLFSVGYGLTGNNQTGVDDKVVQRIRQETSPLRENVFRHLKVGMVCSPEEKSRVFDVSLKGISRHYQKRLAHVLVRHLSPNSGSTPYFMMSVSLDNPSVESFFIPKIASNLFGVPAEGDSGSGLVHNDGYVIGILNHSLKGKQKHEMLVCWVSIAPYVAWIEKTIHKAHG
ncbi:MAG: hypothetical protein BGO28_02180 [Alphaproteobacteria bacterium 43-37]|nr:MAG: hypothetical protein BGO28_02180 [Alphaproteobacteria bacterium 43-37]